MTNARSLSSVDSAALVTALLAQPKAVLSTHLAGGRIHTVPIYFVVDSARVLCSTYRASQKVRNVLRDPTASLLLERGTGYQDLRGALLHGSVEVLDLPAEAVAQVSARVFEKYQGRSPDEAAWVELRRQAAKRVVLAFTWQREVVWDHTRAPSQFD